jgi:hypothetical protein
MRDTQLSVFLENRPGRLAHLLQVLSAAQVNLRALSVADSADFGVVRLIVSDTQAALRALQEAGLVAVTTTVLRAEIPDVPGGMLHGIVEPLAEAGVNIEYTYAYSERPSERAVVVLKVDDLEKAEKVLEQRAGG